MQLSDKIMLRKRVIIETVCDELNNTCQIKNTYHINLEDNITNLISDLITKSFNLKTSKQ